MIVLRINPIKLTSSGNCMLVACPGTASHATHHIPNHCGTEDLVNPRATIAHHAEAAVDSFTDAHSAAVM